MCCELPDFHSKVLPGLHLCAWALVFDELAMAVTGSSPALWAHPCVIRMSAMLLRCSYVDTWCSEGGTRYGEYKSAVAPAPLISGAALLMHIAKSIATTFVVAFREISDLFFKCEFRHTAQSGKFCFPGIHHAQTPDCQNEKRVLQHSLIQWQLRCSCFR